MLTKKHFEKLAEVLGTLQAFSENNDNNIKIKIVINELVNHFCLPFNNNLVLTKKKAPDCSGAFLLIWLDYFLYFSTN